MYLCVCVYVYIHTHIHTYIQTESTRFAINGSFGEIIAFQDCRIKRIIRTLERKNKKLENNKDSVFFNQTCVCVCIYIYIYIYIY